ncbi:Type I site-specific restriction-modification system, R (restriction) subunit and related helicases [Canicola haemoglobinophilus]|uniref:Type I restriction enzyme endonuclease subunit n=1 Tax=Canicola haemoglobinophilus TaxID=733 RepID=A0A377HRV8_9PAST|nr:Type I site-specific restriction-modification system, R (restriction) subunit and related helicases [Canicola haemoglobinophilus]
MEYQLNDEQKVEFARLIDFSAVQNNHFLAVNQLTITGRKGNRRPDVLCYINGLPIAVFELKNPLKENATLTDAFNQLQTYKQEITDLFVFNQLLVISDGIDAKIGSLTANIERFSPWRVVDEKNKSQRILFENELDGLVQGLFSPENLLNYVQNFILFERDNSQWVKKIAAYHQFYGVNEAVDCTLLATGEQGDGRIGVMWHTQGSGKSISMLFYAAKLLALPQLQNPTIVVVTDRNDLDGQLYETFSKGEMLLRQQPVQADGRNELRDELAKRETGGIIFTTIQKFGLQEGEFSHPVLNSRKNIIVISDEAHRSQYGFIQQQITLNKEEKTAFSQQKIGYAKHLRDALPNAAFIGFTGTPIELEDRDTQAVFGQYVSVYDFQDAVEDGATVPMYYEARQIRLGESKDFSAVMEEARRYDVENNRFPMLAALLSNDSRLDQLVENLIEHFEQRIALLDGKAMIVAMSREICVRLYQKIVALRPEWGGDPEDVHQGAIKIVMTGGANDPADFQPHVYSHQQKKVLEKRFKDPNDPLKLVIVRDMWLTGFDAPCCHTMYLDKPMQGHNLMQAIARVNRVFRNKNGGLIVDYFGLDKELETAMKQYTNSRNKEKPVTDVEEVFNKMLTFLDIIRGQFATPVQDKAFDLAEALVEQDEKKLFVWLQRAANHILALDHQSPKQNRLSTFLKSAQKARQGLNLSNALPKVGKYRQEIIFYDGVRAMLSKDKSAGSNIDRALQLAKLVNQAVTSEGVVDLVALLGREQPNINLLSDDFLEMVRDSELKELWASALERYVRSEISNKAASNLALKKDFEQRLKEALNKYHNHGLTVMDVIEELIELSKLLAEQLQRGEELGLTPSELAFYDTLAQNESAVRELGDETLKKLAKEITEKIRRSVTIDWQFKSSVQAAMRVLVRRALQFYKYPPDKQPEAIENVLKQAEILADELSS